MTSLTLLRNAAGDIRGGERAADGLHAMRREVLEAIASGKPLAAVAATLCDHLARLAPGAACGVLLVDDTGRLRALAASGMPEAVLRALEGREPASFGRTVDTGDSAADPLWQSCRAPALAAGLRACRSILVRAPDGAVIGTLAFYHADPGGTGCVTGELAASGAQLCALAIGHERMQGGLREASRRFELALNHLPQGVCFLDAERHLIVANDRFAEIYDLSPAALHPGMTPPQLMALRAAAGSAPALAPGPAPATDAKAGETVVELVNGRVVAVTRRAVARSGWVETHEDITERRRVEARIVYLAQYDALTGLLNRALFQERMEQALGRTGPGQQCAALLLDFDRFKAINEGFGHGAGDAILQIAASRLRGCVRDEDMPTRIGGDKFGVLLVGIAGPEAAGEVAQRILHALGAPYALGDHLVEASVSIGVAITPDDGLRGEALLRSAELALYRAKTEESGTCRFSEPGMDARLHARMTLKTELRAALDAGQFELWYQPLIGRSGAICAFEALLRWRHPSRGIVSPAEFIPLAEETGLILPLGDWVLRQACAEAAHWPDAVRVAVNLSPAQFRRHSLVDKVRASLAESGLPAARLELEITESLLLANTEATLGMLHELRRLGVGIAMDDFGSGYSSLRYLRSFPFDKVKIDRAFIRDLPDQADSIAIVRAVVTLCHSLGIATTAEGVETEDQMHHLQSEGCTELQGFLFSRPRPASEIPLLLGAAPGRWTAHGS